MFYRYEVRIGSDKPWEGGFQCLFPDQLRHIGRYLKEPKWYKNHPDVDTRCWFTQEGFDKYGDLVEEAIKERGVLNYPTGQIRDTGKYCYAGKDPVYTKEGVICMTLKFHLG